MFYPALASVHAEARYRDLLSEAQAERRVRKPRRARRSLSASLIALILGAR